MAIAYLHAAPVEMCALRVIGHILTLGSRSTHSQLYWMSNGSWVMTELTRKPLGPNSRAIGRGHNYTIQLTKVDGPIGMPFECDIGRLEWMAMSYGNASKGLIYGGYRLSPHPCGHGGPIYGAKATCNTYISWLVRGCARQAVTRPKGVIGWDSIPMFPDSRRGLGAIST